MNRKLFWIGLSIVVTIATPFMGTQISNSAIPPLSHEYLNVLSDYVVIGQVTQTQRKEVFIEFGTNYEYKVLVKVEQLEQNKTVEKRTTHPKSLRPQTRAFNHIPTPGKIIEVHYWTSGKRLPGWTGAQGENLTLEKGVRGKLFIRKDEQGKLHVLEPNGWQPIAQKAVK